MIHWRKSRRSNLDGGTCCVELADLGEGVRGIRDSKTPDGPHLTVTPRGLATLVHDIRAGA